MYAVNWTPLNMYSQRESYIIECMWWVNITKNEGPGHECSMQGAVQWSLPILILSSREKEVLIEVEWRMTCTALFFVTNENVRQPFQSNDIGVHGSRLKSEIYWLIYGSILIGCYWMKWNHVNQKQRINKTKERHEQTQSWHIETHWSETT